MRFLGVLLAAAALAGCASDPHLMPTPAVFKDERLDFAPRLPPELRSTHLPVFYATTRAPVPAGEPEWIATDVTISLRYPIPPERRCLVNKPTSKRVWRFPDDYPHCVAERLLAAYPELRRAGAR